MSILNPRRIARNAKADFPATIRPVPRTFALGILPVEAIERTEFFDVPFVAECQDESRHVAVAEVASVTPAEAVQGKGLDRSEDWVCNAAANEARYLAAVQAAKDDETLAVSTEREEIARKAARLAAATKIVTEAPRCDWPRVETPAAVPSFADELVKAVFRPRSSFHPSATDHAWELGYSLGRDGIAANPYHATHDESMAFLAGHKRGLVAYQDDQRDEVEAVIAAWEDIYAYGGLEEHEWAEAGSALGYAS